MCVEDVLQHGVNDSVQTCRELGEDKYVLRQLESNQYVCALR